MKCHLWHTVWGSDHRWGFSIWSSVTFWRYSTQAYSRVETGSKGGWKSVFSIFFHLFSTYPYLSVLPLHLIIFSSWFTHYPNTWTLGTFQCAFSVPLSSSPTLRPFPDIHQLTHDEFWKKKRQGGIFPQLPTASHLHATFDHDDTIFLKLLDLLLRQLQLLRGLENSAQSFAGQIS